MTYPFATALDDFLAEINGLHVSLPIIMTTIGEANIESSKNVRAFLDEHGTLIKEDTNNSVDVTVHRKAYKVSLDHFYDLETLRSIAINFNAASAIIPRSFLVSMISQFDAFLANLIKAIYNTKPELLNTSERNISFANLTQFASLDDAREYVLEKEVESVLRESHAEHFDWLERKLGMELRKGLNVWADFIELTERRNLFVHADGVVSSQYLAVCNKHKVKLDDNCKLGQSLAVDRRYFAKSYNILFELATKLSQVLWRKLLPQDMEIADDYLNRVCYPLLKKEQYSLAKELLDFAVNLPRHSSQKRKLIFVVNSAIAHKWGGLKDESATVLSKVDWSAYSDDFQISVAALEDRYDDAVSIMYRIGKTSSVTKPDYKDWPVFREFRKTEQFKKAFQEIFGEDVDVIEITNGDVVEVVDADETVDFEALQEKPIIVDNPNHLL